jgi:hypothetical protein
MESALKLLLVATVLASNATKTGFAVFDMSPVVVIHVEPESVEYFTGDEV